MTGNEATGRAPRGLSPWTLDHRRPDHQETKTLIRSRIVASTQPLKGIASKGKSPSISTWSGFTIITPDTVNPLAAPSNAYLLLCQCSRKLLIFSPYCLFRLSISPRIRRRASSWVSVCGTTTLNFASVGWSTPLLPVPYLIFTALAALSASPFGHLADQFGAKCTLLVSFALLGLTFLIGGIAHSGLAILPTFFCYGLHKA